MTTAKELANRIKALEVVSAPGPGVIYLDEADYEAQKEELHKKNHPDTVYIIDNIHCRV